MILVSHLLAKLRGYTTLTLDYSLPSVRWAGASRARSQWLTSFHIFLQLLPLICATTVSSFCFSTLPFVVQTGVTLFWEVTGREHCQGKSGFPSQLDPKCTKLEQSHQMCFLPLSQAKRKTKPLQWRLVFTKALHILQIYVKWISASGQKRHSQWEESDFQRLTGKDRVPVSSHRYKVSLIVITISFCDRQLSCKSQNWNRSQDLR